MTSCRIVPRPGPHLALDQEEETDRAFCLRLAIALVEETVPAVVIDHPSYHSQVVETDLVVEIVLVVETDREVVIDPVVGTDHPSCRYQVIVLVAVIVLTDQAEEIDQTDRVMVIVPTDPATVIVPIGLATVTVPIGPAMVIDPIGPAMVIGQTDLNVHRERGLRSTCLSTHRSIDHQDHVPRDGDHQGHVHQDGVHQATDHLCIYRCMAAASGIAIHGAGAGIDIP